LSAELTKMHSLRLFFFRDFAHWVTAFLNYFRCHTFSSWQTHKERCPYLPTKCPNRDCQTFIIRKDVEEHQLHCDFRPIGCDHCRVEVPLNRLKVCLCIME